MAPDDHHLERGVAGGQGGRVMTLEDPGVSAEAVRSISTPDKVEFYPGSKWESALFLGGYQFLDPPTLITAVEANPDGSTDLYFGPRAPEGRADNWLQTVPGKGWWTILRLYNPLPAFFDKTWRPSEIEPI
jgi:hypothetical protein